MALCGSENNEIALCKSNSPLKDETLLFKDDPSSANNAPSRQNPSLFSLTLNQIQTKSGKSVGSMNIDEFLANLWSVDVEDNQVQSNGQFQQQDEHSVSNANYNSINVNDEHKTTSLARQDSFSIPSPLSKKTVDEIWFQLQKDQSNNNEDHSLSVDASIETMPPHRQQTLGEMTLEDFLVKVGIIRQVVTVATTPPMTPMHCLDAAFGMAFPSPPNNIGCSFPPTPNVVFTSLPVFSTQNKGNVGEPLANDAISNDETETGPSASQSKKRIISGPPEVLRERRQRRMIKNRESAARSRARKQAYTMELELELTQLKEENAKLKHIVEQAEKNKKEVVWKTKSKKAQKDEEMKSLRRTVSLAW